MTASFILQLGRECGRRSRIRSDTRKSTSAARKISSNWHGNGKLLNSYLQVLREFMGSIQMFLGGRTITFFNRSVPTRAQRIAASFTYMFIPTSTVFDVLRYVSLRSMIPYIAAVARLTN